jgi:hypothetical protein
MSDIGTGDFLIDSGRVLTRGQLDEMTEEIMNFNPRQNIWGKVKDIYYSVVDRFSKPYKSF